MPSIEYLEQKMLLLENEINSLQNTMERIGILEREYSRVDSILTFIVGFLLSPDTPPVHRESNKKACEKMLKKWYYGGHKSRRVTLAAAELDKLNLSELRK